MAINEVVSLQYNGGLLPDMMLLIEPMLLCTIGEPV